MDNRWTKKDLEETNDYTFAAAILQERLMKLNPYSPLAEKLTKVSRKLLGKGQDEMQRAETKACVMALAASEDSSEAYEELAESFAQAFASEDTPYRKIGRQMMMAYLDGDADAMITAICGWSFDTLLVRAGLKEDADGVIVD